MDPATSTAARDLEPVEDFFARYTGYLSSGDIEGLASIYNAVTPLATALLAAFVFQVEKLTRGQRLTRRPDFLVVQERGRRVSGSSYLLLALARPAAPQGAGARLGITVSKKVGKAAVRNQVKRWVRESYRRMSELAPAGTDLVVVARPRCR